MPANKITAVLRHADLAESVDLSGIAVMPGAFVILIGTRNRRGGA
jgi:hypothetical protein